MYKEQLQSKKVLNGKARVIKKTMYNNGNIFRQNCEKKITSILGFPVVNYGSLCELNGIFTDYYGKTWECDINVLPGIAVREFPFTKYDGIGTGFGGKFDVLLLSNPVIANYEIRVEFRYQEQPGTAYEKHGHFILQSKMNKEFKNHVMITGGNYLVNKSKDHQAYKIVARNESTNACTIEIIDGHELENWLKKLKNFPEMYSNGECNRWPTTV